MKETFYFIVFSLTVHSQLKFLLKETFYRIKTILETAWNTNSLHM